MARLAAPEVLLGAIHLYAFAGVLGNRPASNAVAWFFEDWPVSEILALCVSPFVVAMFAPNPAITRLDRLLVLRSPTASRCINDGRPRGDRRAAASSRSSAWRSCSSSAGCS